VSARNVTAARRVHAGAAPAWRRVLSQGAFEARTILRNGEQLLLTLVLPSILLVALPRTSLVDGATTAARLGVVVPGVLAVAVMSTSFTSQAIMTAFDRRNGVLRFLATTPLGRGGLLTGKILAVLAIELGQVLVLVTVAGLLGWRPGHVDPGAAALALALGTAAFTAFGLLMAGTLRAEAVLAGANLVWALLLVGGGVILPVSTLPGPAAAVARLLPSGALGEALRSAVNGAHWHLAALAVLTMWAAIGALLTRRFFRWSS
jgi:ABC-2 type transport system permease protein